MAAPSVHAAIVRRVAARAVLEARQAWTKAHENPTATTTLEAYRACVLAERTLRKAAAEHPRERRKMLDQAKRIETTGKELLAEHVRLTA